MKNHFTVIFILLFASVHSQELLSSISGTVKDDYNNPLAFATVMIEGLKLGVLTDDNGSFIIENVPQEKHNVVVSFIGK